MKNKLLEFLKDNYPSLITEVEDNHFEVNINRLMEELNECKVDEEGYYLNWLGKSYAKVLRDYPITTLLAPDSNHNNIEENKKSENIYIEGDNLEVLKHLKNAYTNKIKIIYIDPPYNTGNDGFVYNDSYNFKEEDLIKLANVDEDEAKKILNYMDNNRNSHSAWLTFIYPRLYIARQLLSEDGVIFISIDDNEQAQLKLVCDEIFGENNFIADFIWEKTYSPKNNNKFASENHEYIFCYAKNKIKLAGLQKLTRKENNNKLYIYDDNDGKGLYRYDNITINGKKGYDIKWHGKVYKEPSPSGWRYTEEKMYKLIKENRIYLPEDESKRPMVKRYLNEVGGITTKTILEHELVGHTDQANKHLKKLFGEIVIFNYPKPILLIQYLINLINLEDGYLLDFFSGSATSAEAVMRLNAQDNGNRKYIMVQLPEEIDPKKSNEAYDFCKNELNSKNPIIPDIAKERIKRAAKVIKEENKDKEYIDRIDFGFKVYKTIEDKRTKMQDLEDFNPNQKLLFDTDDLDALLITWMLYDGYDLNKTIVDYQINNYKGYLVESTLYLLDKGFSTNDLKTLVEKLNDTNMPVINRIVLNETNFSNKLLAEFNEQIFDKNIKEVNINVIKRSF